MTKKDYQLLAYHISRIKDSHARYLAADAVAVACWSQSVKFDYKKFMETCCVEPLDEVAKLFKTRPNPKLKQRIQEAVHERS